MSFSLSKKKNNISAYYKYELFIWQLGEYEILWDRELLSLGDFTVWMYHQISFKIQYK